MKYISLCSVVLSIFGGTLSCGSDSTSQEPTTLAPKPVPQEASAIERDITASKEIPPFESLQTESPDPFPYIFADREYFGEAIRYPLRPNVFIFQALTTPPMLSLSVVVQSPEQLNPLLEANVVQCGLVNYYGGSFKNLPIDLLKPKLNEISQLRETIARSARAAIEKKQKLVAKRVLVPQIRLFLRKKRPILDHRSYEEFTQKIDRWIKGENIRLNFEEFCKLTQENILQGVFLSPNKSMEKKTSEIYIQMNKVVSHATKEKTGRFIGGRFIEDQFIEAQFTEAGQYMLPLAATKRWLQRELATHTGGKKFISDPRVDYFNEDKTLILDKFNQKSWMIEQTEPGAPHFLIKQTTQSCVLKGSQASCEDTFIQENMEATLKRKQQFPGATLSTAFVIPKKIRIKNSKINLDHLLEIKFNQHLKYVNSSLQSKVDLGITDYQQNSPLAADSSTLPKNLFQLAIESFSKNTPTTPAGVYRIDASTLKNASQKNIGSESGVITFEIKNSQFLATEFSISKTSPESVTLFKNEYFYK